MRIFINPGHAPNGKPDPGAIGPTGVQEWRICREVAVKLAALLAQHSVQVLQSDSLAEIVDTANQWGADCVISLHCNSAVSAEAHGCEIYTTRGVTAADALATAIMTQIKQRLPSLTVRADYTDGDIDKEVNFYVLKYTAAPAILLEMAFISHPEEEACLADGHFQQALAGAVAAGIAQWAANNKN